MTNLQGKIALVTGANSGIGLETALGLAKMGAQVVMVARDKKRGEEALADVKQRSGSNSVELMLADLGSQADICTLTENFKRRHNRLDVLINNAAIIPTKREVTVDGIERQFAVNHLAYFLLTNLLLDVLKASAPARIVVLSSKLHFSGKLDFDDLQAEKAYSQMGISVYNNTKLYNVLFTVELARRLQGTGVTVNAVHPGVLGTRLTRGLPSLLHKIYLAVMPSAAEGAKPPLYVATSPELEGISGKYFDRLKMLDPLPIAHDAAAGKRLWDISAELTHLN